MEEIQTRLYQWSQLDNQLKVLNKQSSLIRKQKEELQKQVIPILEHQQLTENTFSIPALKTTVLCKTQVSNDSLSYKYLLEIFESYFNSSEKAIDLLDYIKQNRKKQTSRVLKTTELIEDSD